MEEVVMRKMEELSIQLGMCTCESCLLDVAAYTLNRIPPKYIATTKGELLAKLDVTDVQISTNITSTIVMAANIVKQHPRH